MALGRFLRNVLAWLVPVALVWLLLTPFYNRFLIVAGENLLLLTESPNVTDLLPRDDHYALISRRDFPAARSVVYSFRVTDLHFPTVLLAALFLAVPAVPWRRRLGGLGWALLATAFLHLALVFSWVQFAYATQLGDWSLEHYSPAGRELWGLAKHLLDLPVKLGWPLGLWALFHLPLLTARGEPTPAARRRAG